ncbi:uncharacterized protein [Thunnus thynnus]|uniref:uncharacterized protein n=1 Tax=Thunnus thynnus TaxID=8237 RepID=UPI003528340D
MSRPNYDHIQTLEDLKNEFFALQRHNEFLRREKESLQQDNESLQRDHKALSLKNEVLEQENRSLIQRMDAMEANNLACMKAMSQQHDNLHKEIQQLKRHIRDERSVQSVERIRVLEFQMGLEDTMKKMYAELRSKTEEVEGLKVQLSIAAEQNCKETGSLIRSMGDIFNEEKMERHRKKNHWFYRWFW